MNGIQLNIFLVQNFFINNWCCWVMHASTLNIPLFGSTFCKKGYSSHCRVNIKLSGLVFFSPPLWPKRIKIF